MPKLTLLLGRKTMQVYDLPGDEIVVGRDEGADVLIDNPSVSRRHARLRKEAEGWVVEDLGSSNGTFMHGQRIDGPHPLKSGDEVGFGKFSILFDKAVGDMPAPHAAAKPQPAMAGAEGTMHIKAHEVKELLQDSERKRRAHLAWESGGQKGVHYLSESPAALFGTSTLCDVRVPKGPKNHVFVMIKDGKCEVRCLPGWGVSMTVGGRKAERAMLKDGDTVESKGLKMTFVADIN